MKKQKSIGNKGFSLVELIIVIAIMAILIGVMAPQLMKYVERSRESADKQVADTVRTAIVTALLDPAVEDGPTSVSGQSLAYVLGLTKDNPKFVAAVSETLNKETAAQVNARLKSKAYKPASGADAFLIDISGTQVTVTLKANSGVDGATDFVIK